MLLEMAPVVQDQSTLPKAVVHHQCFRRQAAGRLTMESSKEQGVVDLVELAVETQFSEKAQVGTDEGAEEGSSAKGVDPHDSVLRVAVLHSLPQAAQPGRRLFLHQVQRRI